MRRAVATQVAQNPAEVIKVVDFAPPEARAGWTLVHVRAAALNQHDLWSIRGIGVMPEQFPLGIASDVAGVTDDGREVIVHSLVADPDRGGGTELLDPRRAMLAEATTGGAADVVLVPDRNLVDKPAELDFTSAACLPTAWLTAYHMLFTAARARPGQVVLVQGAAGGVAQAATTLAVHAGLRAFVTGRDARRRKAAEALGADAVLEAGQRLPERADVVIDTVGAATWDHSLKSVKPGGTVVVAGATTGGSVGLDLFRLFLQHVRILGTSMGTVDELRDLVTLVATARISPAVDSVHDLGDAAAAVGRLASGDAVGKVLIRP
jgi:NADPH:quinone reductase-like Zn-dependent oxidoreductase